MLVHSVFRSLGKKFLRAFFTGLLRRKEEETPGVIIQETSKPGAVVVC